MSLASSKVVGGGDFVYDIPPDHMGGTFWYHAHHHGSTFLQVSSGAFGLIIIDDSSDGIPTNVANMAERHLIMAYLDPSVAGTGGDSLISGTLDPTWTANGTVAGNLCMPPDTWQHWRVLLADRDARTKTLTVGAGCEVALMARDGVWRTEVRRACRRIPLLSPVLHAQTWLCVVARIQTSPSPIRSSRMSLSMVRLTVVPILTTQVVALGCRTAPDIFRIFAVRP